MKHYSIKQQTLLIALIPVIVMTVLLSGYLIYTRSIHLDQSLLERAQLIARQLSSTSEYAVFSGNMPLLKQDVEAALAQPDVEAITVLDAGSKQLLAEDKETAGSEEWHDKVNASARIYQDDKMLLLCQPIEPAEIKLDDPLGGTGVAPPQAKPLGLVLVKLSKTGLNAQKKNLLLLNIIVTLLALVLSLAVAARVSRRIIAPILNMGQDIRQLGSGHLGARTSQQTGIHELNELAAGINTMAQKLQEERDLLENRVQARTAELEAANHKLAMLSISDGLTELSNRRHIDQVMATEWRRCARQGQPLSFIMIDIDHFKSFNDYYGHQKGDECLCRVATVLAAHAQRSGETAARYGGEEFALIMPGISPEEAENLAEKVRLEVAALAIPHEKQAPGYVTVSLGVATIVPDEGKAYASLVGTADAALYRAKNAGRNCVVVA
jgi:diguanylate cyclase (GGDEF)-like protein